MPGDDRKQGGEKDNAVANALQPHSQPPAQRNGQADGQTERHTVTHTVSFSETWLLARDGEGSPFAN